MPHPQMFIDWKLIRQATPMGQQIPNRYLVSAVSLEFRQELPRPIFQLKLSLIVQRHQGRDINRFGNRGDQKYRLV